MKRLVFLSKMVYNNAREKEIFEKLKKDGVIKDRKEGWAADPYDPSYKNDTLKNLSDNEEYDNGRTNHQR